MATVHTHRTLDICCNKKQCCTTLCTSGNCQIACIDSNNNHRKKNKTTQYRTNGVVTLHLLPQPVCEASDKQAPQPICVTELTLQKNSNGRPHASQYTNDTWHMPPDLLPFCKCSPKHNILFNVPKHDKPCSLNHNKCDPSNHSTKAPSCRHHTHPTSPKSTQKMQPVSSHTPDAAQTICNKTTTTTPAHFFQTHTSQPAGTWSKGRARQGP